jgi:hypothetical protein
VEEEAANDGAPVNIGGIKGMFEAAPIEQQETVDDGEEYYSNFVDVSMSPW